MKPRFTLSSSLALAACLTGTFPAHAQSAPAESPNEEDPLDVPDGKFVSTATVRLDPDSSLRLETLEDGSRDWEPSCRAPCGEKLRLDAMYRVAGDDVRTSAPFRLAAAPNGQVDLHVDKVHSTPHTLGIVLTVVGGVALGLGGIGAVAAALASSVEHCDADAEAGMSCNQNTSGLVAAGLIAAAGLGSLVAGIVLLGNNQNSEVTQEIGGPAPPPRAELLLPRRGEEPPSAADASWRVGALESPKAFTIPLIGVTF